MLGTGILRKTRAYRERVLLLLHIKKQWVEEVDEYLLALGRAQALYLAASTPVASVAEAIEMLLRASG